MRTRILIEFLDARLAELEDRVVQIEDKLEEQAKPKRRSLKKEQ